MYYWLRFFHIASGLAFMAVHGASIVVLYAVRKEDSRAKIQSLMAFSAKTVLGMYISLGLVIATGVWLGFLIPAYFSLLWYWLSLGTLALITLLMWLIARPFGKRILAACEIRPSGVPRVSDEELAVILKSQKTNAIAAIGIIGLGFVLYLMVFRPVF